MVRSYGLNQQMPGYNGMKKKMMMMMILYIFKMPDIVLIIL